MCDTAGVSVGNMSTMDTPPAQARGVFVLHRQNVAAQYFLNDTHLQ